MVVNSMACKMASKLLMALYFRSTWFDLSAMKLIWGGRMACISFTLLASDGLAGFEQGKMKTLTQACTKRTGSVGLKVFRL